MTNLYLNRPETKAIRLIRPGSTTTLAWGRGVGKSWFERLAAYRLVSEWDGKLRVNAPLPLYGIRIVLLMPTLKACKDIHGKHIPAELSPSGLWGGLGGEINRSDWLIRFPGGSWIQMFGAERADSARGIRADMVICDEADDIDMSDYDGVVKPWFSEPWSLNIRVVGGTPKRGRHGLLWRTYDQGRPTSVEKLPNYESVFATYKDAPETVSAQTVEEARRDTAPATFEREWECNFDSGEGLVYPMFDESFHIREPDPRIVWSEFIVGMDHGYEDPTAIIVWGVAGSGRDATVHALEEVYQSKLTTSDCKTLLLKLKAKYDRKGYIYWFADPSKPGDIEEYRRAGIPFRGALNTPIEDGISAVADRMAIRERDQGDGEVQRYGRLFISGRCPNLIKELGLYRRRRDPRNADHILDVPEDRNNHACDAMRYAIFTRFGSPMVIRSFSDDGLPNY